MSLKKYVDRSFGYAERELYEIKKYSSNPIERNIAKLLLNSLYGRFRVKEITSTIKFMSNKDQEQKNK